MSWDLESTFHIWTRETALERAGVVDSIVNVRVRLQILKQDNYVSRKKVARR